MAPLGTVVVLGGDGFCGWYVFFFSVLLAGLLHYICRVKAIELSLSII